MKNNILLTIIISLFAFPLLIAQQDFNVLAIRKLEKKNTSKLPELYERKAYMQYVDGKDNSSAEDENDVVAMRKIANSFRMNADYLNAEDWYSKFVNQNSIKEDILHYAQTLQANGRCKDAVKWFYFYESKLNDKDETDFDFIENCDDLKEFSNHESVSLINLRNLNTEGLDFSAISAKDGIYFTSNRSNSVSNKDAWTNSNFTNLFFAAKNDKGFETPVDLNMNSKYHDGVCTVASDQKFIFFTRNEMLKKNKKQEKKLNIYFSEIQDGLIGNPISFPLNSEEYSNAHPTLSPDNTTLYFSSDQPGGYGGMDIYMSKNISGNWTTPVNLGPKVNTEGNEVFPFIAKDDELYFSSNGHAGFGGLDLFIVKKENNSWKQRKNCGRPFNSSMDDFGFYTSDNKEGFLSSNRPGGLGKDDIYSWSSTEKIDFFTPIKVARTICFVESGSNKKVPEVNIALTNSKNNSFGMQFKSDDKGFFSYEMLKNTTYEFSISKDAYETSKLLVNSNDNSFSQNECLLVELKKKESPLLKASYKNAVNKKALKNLTFELKSPCLSKPKKIKSNANGEIVFKLDCNCQYELRSSNPNYEIDTKTFSTNENCYGQKDFNFDILLKEKKKVVYNTLVGKKKIEKGMVIDLKNIYYDYNKSNIRKESLIDLNNLVDLMNQYPSMKIELGSHTDSRGTDSYNKELSSKRAEAARQYLISKNISPKRITSKGYGETQLLNHCKNDVNCEESLHQMNRRTEVIITNLDDQSIKFNYKN